MSMMKRCPDFLLGLIDSFQGILRADFRGKRGLLVVVLVVIGRYPSGYPNSLFFQGHSLLLVGR
jgi:hypothetical protein